MFGDLYESCVRRQSLRPDMPTYPLFVPPGSKEAAPKDNPAIDSCSQFQAEGKELTTMSNVLDAYFKSMEQLAGFDTVALGGNVETIAENATTAADLSTTQIESAGKLANLITQLATAGYQRKRLFELLKAADPEVTDVTQAFDQATKTYLDLLNQEQQTLAAQYQSVGDASTGSTLFLLNHAYSQDLDKLQQRRTEANAYLDVTKNIREGHHKLVANEKKLRAKDLSAALRSYISKIDGALPLLAKKT